MSEEHGTIEQEALFDDGGEAPRPGERLRLLVHFLTRADRQAFAYLVGQRIGEGTESISWPVAGRLPPELLHPAADVADVAQPALLDVEEPWQEAWRGMPAYAHQDLEPLHTIAAYFDDQASRRAFAKLLDHPITDETKSMWFPQAEVDKVVNMRWRSTRPQNPKYPVYVPTKGRWDSAFTIKCLERLCIPYHAVVQPQERQHYEQVIKTGVMLLLPGGLDGLVPTRNWILDHATAAGAERHWQLDDNIKSFFRYHDNRQIHVADGTCMRIAEDFADRYENIAIAGFQYFMFVKRKFGFWPPYVFNTRVYSNSLINNRMPFRYRDVYNDDTDICLRALKDGWCTVQFNAFLAWKQPTMQVKGGNTPIYLGAEKVAADWAAHVRSCKRCTIDESPTTCEAGRAILQQDGRWRMADSLQRQHPDVTTITRKWSRWQHQVDYRRFKKNVPVLRPGVVIPEGQDEYGLELIEVQGTGLDLTDDPTPVERRLAPSLPDGTPPSGPSALDFLQVLRARRQEDPARQEPVAAPPEARQDDQGKAPAQEEWPTTPSPGQPGGLPRDQPDLPGLRASLEARGHLLRSLDGRLLVGRVVGAGPLTDEDRALLTVHREALIALLAPPRVVEVAVPRATQSLAQFLGGEPPRVDPSYRPDEFPDLSGIDEITLNFETTGYRWWAGDVPIGVTIGTIDQKMVRFLPWGFAGGNLPKEQVLEFLRREVRNKRITNANTRFEVHVARNVGIDLEEQGCTVSDVQHYAALLDDSRRKFNVDLLADELLGGVKVPRVDEARMATYHASEVAARARYQVELVAQLRDIMWPRLNAEDLQRVRQLEDDVIYPVCEMERNGVPIDVELLERWVKESQAQHEGCLLALYKETGQSINPNAPSDLEKLFNYLNLPVTRLESGAPSFTDAILKRVQHPLIKQLRFAIKLSDLRSRYLLKYQRVVGSDGILRYAMHQVRYQKDSGEEGGAGPGRFSSAELDPDVGCNIQQVIKVSKQRKMFGLAEKDASHDDEIYLIRKLAIPREGAWLCADAEQIEYRIFADYSNNCRFITAYKDDPRLNFHTLIEGLLREHRVAIDYDGAKTYNFATIYGAGQVKRATMLGFITEEEGAEIRDKKLWNDARLEPLKAIDKVYNRLVPEVKALLTKASDLAASRGYVKTKMGRRSRFYCAKDARHAMLTERRYHKAFNNVDQGGAADYNKVKLVEVHRERKHTGFLLRVSVHDEMDGDAREPDTLEKVRAILDRQSWPEMKVPLTWDVKLGRNWAEAK